MIKPTIGRIVWYWSGASEDGQAEPAIVCYVHNDKMVNLHVIDGNGVARAQTSVVLKQEEDPPAVGEHASWMPFQIGSAKQYEKIGSGTTGDFAPDPLKVEAEALVNPADSAGQPKAAE